MPGPVFEEGKKPVKKPEPAKPPEPAKDPGRPPLSDLQKQVGNRAVQRLIQRGGGGPAEIDEETAGRINRARGGGQTLDEGVEESMGAAIGYDFSGVRVHTGGEADELNQSLSAQAFTTGSDIFFKEGAYEPNTGSGQELLAHELTHVVQQGTGKTGGGSGGMTLNEPGDAHEQEADRTAAAVTGGEPASVHRQEELPEEEVMMQPIEEEEEMLQPKRAETDLQRQEEEEEMIQPRLVDPSLQRQEVPEEEELIQQQEEEEEQAQE